MTPILKMSNAGGMDATLNRYSDMLAGNAAYNPGAFESIATATPTTGQIVTFSSIPNTYKSLQIRITGLIASSENYGVRFNGDSGTNYTLHYLYGNGTSVLVAGYATPFDSKISINANSYISQASPNPLVSIIDIHDYTSTSKNKTLKAFSGADNNAGNGKVGLGSGVWLSTAAITSLSVVTDLYNFMSGTSIALYGIKG